MPVSLTSTTISIDTKITSSDTAVVTIKGISGLKDINGNSITSISENLNIAGLNGLDGFVLLLLQDLFDDVKYNNVVVDNNKTTNELVAGSAGNHNAIVVGGFGNDTIIGNGVTANPLAQTNGSEGTNILISRSLAGQTGSTIYAGSGANLIYGGNGNDVIYGSTKLGSSALVFAGPGNNTVFVNSESGLFYLEQGNDIANYSVTAGLNSIVYIDAGKGMDTLKINLTAAQAGIAWVQNALAAFQTVLMSSNTNNVNGPIFNFSSFDPNNCFGISFSGLLNLTVRNFEKVIITIENQNLAPVITVDALSANLFVAGRGAVGIESANALITDLDSPNLVSLKATITNLINGASESLSAITAGTSITASYSNGVLNLTGTDTLAHYTQVLASIMYNNTSGVVNTAPRIISFVASDGTSFSNTATTTISLDNAPVGAADAASVAANSMLNINVLANDTDPDAGQTLSIDPNSLGYVDGSGVFHPGIVTASGATLTILTVGGQQVIQYNPSTSAALQNLPVGSTIVDTFQYSPKDSLNVDSNAPVTVTVTVQGALVTNHAPVATADVKGSAANPILVTAASNIDVLANDTDPDAGNTATLKIDPNSLGYTDGTGFHSGILTAQGATLSILNTPANAQGQTQQIMYDPTTSAFLQSISYGQIVTDTFQYRAQDTGGLGSNLVTVTVTLVGKDHAPVANPISLSLNADQSVTNQLFPASDPDVGDTLIFSLNLPIANFTINNLTGTYSYDATYLAASLPYGVQSVFTSIYTATDSHGVSSSSSISITVTGIDHAPMIQIPALTEHAAEEGIQSFNIIQDAGISDFDPGDAITLSLMGAPLLVADGSGVLGALNSALGTASFDANNHLIFDPGSAFRALSPLETATVQIHYIASDSHGKTTSGTVDVIVQGDNEAPVAAAISAATDQNTAAVIDVLSSANNADHGDALSVTAVSSGATIDANNQVVFDPGVNFIHLGEGQSEEVIINYTISDSFGATADSTIALTVNGLNDAPTANGASESTNANITIFRSLMATDPDDGDYISHYSIVSDIDPELGTLLIFPWGDFIYDPTPSVFLQNLSYGEYYDVSFTYKATDAHNADSNDAIVTIRVNGVDHAPLIGINPVIESVAEEGIQFFNLISDANISDQDVGDIISLMLLTAPTFGTAIIDGNNQLVYDPGTAFISLNDTQTVVFTLNYLAIDSHGMSTPGVITMEVHGDNDAPIANSDITSTTQLQSVAINVLANDADPDFADMLSVISAELDIVPPASANPASVSIVNNEIVFNPGDTYADLAMGETATVLIHYTISDHAGATSSSTATVTIAGQAIVGTPNDDLLLGTFTADSIIGKAGNDSIVGFEGDDRLQGDQGNDMISGGGGIDTAIYAHNVWNYTFGLAPGYDYTVAYHGIDALNDEGIDKLSSVEHLLFNGSLYTSIIFPFTFYAEPTQSDQIVVGNTNLDTFSPQPVQHVVLFAGDQGASLVAVNGTTDAVLVGGAGNDTMLAAFDTHNIVMLGGIGNDAINWNSTGMDQNISAAYWHNFADFHFAKEINGFTNSLILSYMGAENARDEGTDVIYGSSVNNLIFNDAIYSLNTDNGNATSDNQIVFVPGGTGTFLPFPPFFTNPQLSTNGHSNVVLVGGDGHEDLYVTQNISADPIGATLMGQGGDDNLNGNIGADILIGGQGSDILYGGAGADQYVYRLAADREPGSVDTIYDFSSFEGDKLVFMSPYLTKVSLLNREGAILLDYFGAPPADDMGAVFVQDILNHDLYYDANGSLAGGLQKIIHFAGASFSQNAISVQDIVIITNPNVADAPIAVNDEITINEDAIGGNYFLAPLNNDITSNPDGSLFISGFNTNGTQGMAYLIQDWDGMFRYIGYTPVVFNYPLGMSSAFNYLGLGETATDTFTYSIMDGISHESSTATVTVTVTGLNDAPIANPVLGNAQVILKALPETQDSIDLTSAILAQASDPDIHDVVRIVDLTISPSDPLYNRVALTNDGHLIYNPGNDFAYLAEGAIAREYISYLIGDRDLSDPNLLVTGSYIEVDVIGVNDAPVANDNVSRDLTEADSIFISANELGIDIDQGAILFIDSIDSSGILGSISISPDLQGIFYDANPNLNGLALGQILAETFSFRLRDEMGALSDVKTVTLNVAGVNDVPIANAPSQPILVVDQNTIGTVTEAAILANSFDPDIGETSTLRIQNLSISPVGDVAHGIFNQATLTYNPNGVFNYLAEGQTYLDLFKFNAIDIHGAFSNPSLFRVLVTGVNDAPVVQNVTKSISVVDNISSGGIDVNFNATDADAGETQSLVYTVVQPVEGFVDILENGQFHFTPNSAFINAVQALPLNSSLTVAFNYTATDIHGVGSQASASLVFTMVDHTPVANPDGANGAYFVNEDTTLVIPATTVGLMGVLDNDTDPDLGDVLSIQSVSPLVDSLGNTVTKGSISLINGNIHYTPGSALQFLADSPNDPLTATDTFMYTIRDQFGATSTSTVTVTVIGVKDDLAPIGRGDIYNAIEDTLLTVSNLSGVLANDTDANLDPLSAILVSSTTHGALSLNAQGGFTYMPAANYSGLDSFTYRAFDGTNQSNLVTVNINVAAVNDAPVVDLNGPANAGINYQAQYLAGGPAITMFSPTATVSDIDNGVSRLEFEVHNIRVGNFYTPATSPREIFNVFGTTVNNVFLGFSGNAGPVSIFNVQLLVPSFGVYLTLSQIQQIFGTSYNQHLNDIGSVKFMISGSTDALQSALETMTYQNTNSTISPLPRTIDVKAVDFSNAVSQIAVSTLTLPLPAPQPDAASGSEDTLISIPIATILANDSSGSSTPTLTITDVSVPAGKGSVSIVGGNVIYDPRTDLNYLAQGTSEVVTIQYTVTNDINLSSSSTISVTVNGAYDLPQAIDDSKHTRPGVSTDIAVLANDLTDQGTPLHVSALNTAGTLGSVSINADNSIHYTPNASFNTLQFGDPSIIDHFTYTVMDNVGGSDVGDVYISIERALITDRDVALPTANLLLTPFKAISGPYALAAGGELVTPANASLELDITGVAHGNIITIASTDHSYAFFYMPNDYVGTDSFTYNILQNGSVVGSNTAYIDVSALVATINGTAGNDTINGTAASDVIFGNGGNDVISGKAGNDYISAFNMSSSVTLRGDYGNDILKGGFGAVDHIIGGAGADIMSGGGGFFNFFDYSRASEIGPNQVDTITDFLSGYDTLMFDMPGFLLRNLSTAEQNNILSNVAGIPNENGTGSLFVQDTVNHDLYVDANGAADAGLIKIIHFANNAVINSADIQINVTEIIPSGSYQAMFGTIGQADQYLYYSTNRAIGAFETGLDKFVFERGVSVTSQVFDAAFTGREADHLFTTVDHLLAPSEDTGYIFSYNANNSALYFDANGADAGGNQLIMLFPGVPAVPVVNLTAADLLIVH